MSTNVARIVTGDDAAIPVTLLKGDDTFAIDAGASVKAVLITSDHESVISAEAVQSSAAAGADWANSLVVVTFPAATTALITELGRAKIEIQVVDTLTDTFFVSVDIIKGHLSG